MTFTSTEEMIEIIENMTDDEIKEISVDDDFPALAD